MTKFYLREDWIFRLTSLYQEEKNALKLLHGFTDDVIQKRRKNMVAPTKDFNPDDFDESIGEKRKMNLLDILLQSTINGEPLSDLDIREEVDTFMFEVCITFYSRISDCPNKLCLLRVTTPHHREYYFVCIALLSILTFNGNASKKSEKFWAMIVKSPYLWPC